MRKNSCCSQSWFSFQLCLGFLLECIWKAGFALPRRTFAFQNIYFFFPAVTFLLFFCEQSSYTIHGSHKLHFSATFSLKMSHTVLFTHLKIILLQCFSFFSFSFQFSAVSKWTLRVHLGSAFCASQTHVCVSDFFYLFLFFSSRNFLTFLL